MKIPILLIGFAVALGQNAIQQGGFPRDATSTAIPGVIAAGEKWAEVWRGADNADGLLGLPDGSVLFAQEQNSIVRKLDARDMDSAFVRTHTERVHSRWITRAI